MRSRDVLTYAYEQIADTFAGTVEGLGPDELARRVGPGANPIGWLAWHLLRVQDDHVADVAGTEQVWTAEGWAGRFGLPWPDAATGYGMSDEEVDARPGALGRPAAGLRPRGARADGGVPRRALRRRTSTGSSTRTGTRRSPSASGCSACSPTTCSTSGRRLLRGLLGR
jgi:hypothetical protein